MIYEFENIEYKSPSNSDFYLVTTSDIYSSFNFLSPLSLIPASHPLKKIEIDKGITKDIRELILKQGFPSQLNQIRPLIWNALLNVYPPSNSSNWQETIQHNKDKYLLLKAKYLPYPTNKDIELLHQIKVDLPRTKADLPFFLSKTITNNKETHYDVLKRLLYIYAKENEELSYVQGMNEIMATFYYVFYNYVNKDFLALVESDTYFAFCALMSEISPIFMFNDMSRSHIVVFEKIELLKKCLEVVYNDVYGILVDKGVLIDVYVFKWVVILFAQDLNINDCIMLWDRLFARKENKLDFMCYVCCAVFGMYKQWFVESDIEEAFDLVKEISKRKGKFNINEIISKALEIEIQMNKYHEENKKKIENENKEENKEEDI